MRNNIILLYLGNKSVPVSVILNHDTMYEALARLAHGVRGGIQSTLHPTEYQ